ncbi:hypothetical protein ODS41_03145 [Pyrobaculum sp. 3827-6]|uniref:hypothetical protein n=1 Tax=Pyrobaculum sp. 3827-6 TaxID=2983604 RepID=UPI0021D9A5E7|nr:hypothetical protein [Pyrobaculum sp. 3827-6]MCU7786924.1 hypothetical protein [Pyrobaculum sp. 3827-6]
MSGGRLWAAALVGTVALVTVALYLQYHVAAPPPEPHQTPAGEPPRLLILTAALDSRTRRLEVKVVNLGREAALAADVRVANVSCVFQPVYIQPGGERVVEAVCGHVEANPGTLLPGELATSEGVRHPFIVLVNGSVPG